MAQISSTALICVTKFQYQMFHFQIKDMESTDHKVSKMIDLTFGGSEDDLEKKKTVSLQLVLILNKDIEKGKKNNSLSVTLQ